MKINVFIKAISISVFLSSFFPLITFAAAEPIVHFKFDEGTGSSTEDAIGSILGTFTVVEPMWSTTTPPVAFDNPYALSFESAGDAVDVAWPSELNFGATDPRTFSFWYKPTADGEGTYSRLLSWTSDDLEIAGTENGVSTHKVTYYDGNWHATDITLEIGTWYHITFTYDGTTAKFYIGDELQDEHPLVGNPLAGTLRIGNRVEQLDEGINGLMDDIRIYDYALDATQVANLAAGSDNPDAPPDEDEPVISNIGASALETSATIVWDTNENASSKVIYSTDTSYNLSTNEIDTSTRVLSHEVTLEELTACTEYNYKVISADAAGNYATSTTNSFTTDGCEVEEEQEDTSRKRSGTTIKKRVNTLISQGKFDEVNAIKEKWKSLFEQDSIINEDTTENLDLELGMTNSNVKRLQQVLNAQGYLLAEFGVGSPGNETEYFGVLTKNALTRYQAENGISPAIGYFGPKTRTQMKMVGVEGLWW